MNSTDAGAGGVTEGESYVQTALIVLGVITSVAHLATYLMRKYAPACEKTANVVDEIADVASGVQNVVEDVAKDDTGKAADDAKKVIVDIAGDKKN